MLPLGFAACSNVKFFINNFKDAITFIRQSVCRTYQFKRLLDRKYIYGVSEFWKDMSDKFVTV